MSDIKKNTHDNQKKASRHFRHLNHAHSICYLVIMTILLLSMAGCSTSSSSDEPTVSEKPVRKTRLRISDCQNTATGNTSTTGSWSGGTITVDDIEKCKSREEYLQLVMPCYQFYCNKYGIKYPGVLALQGIYETGVPDQIASLLRTDNNMGGLKYASGTPDATQGSAATNGGYFAHFASVDKYIAAACWQIGLESNGGAGNVYEAACNSSNMEDFTNNLCAVWINGHVGADTGYAHYIIDDYSKYGLSKYEGGTIAGNSAKSSSSSTTTNGSKDLIGDDNVAKIWNYLKADGYSDAQAAGIMGNWQAESGFDPSICQGGGHSDTCPQDGVTGYGLAQWTYGTRQQALHAFASNKGTKDSDLQTQLEFFDSEFADKKEEYCKNNDVEACTRWFHTVYENSADNEERIQRRVSFAQEIFEKFNGTAATNASSAADECSDGDGNQTYGNSGIAEGEKYHQQQGYNNEGDTLISNDALWEACGATTFTIGVNMLLGENKYNNVDVWESSIFGRDSTDCGSSDKTERWIKENGLDSKIEVKNHESSGITVDKMKEWLDDGYIVQISSGDQSKFLSNEGDGIPYHPSGHYILFYKYENNAFYADDPALNKKAGAGVKYSTSDLQQWLGGREFHSGVLMKRK